MIDNLQYALDGSWRVLVASLIFGAGLPAIFALGIRSMAWGSDGEIGAQRAHAGGKAAAVVCFAVVAAGAVLGITIIAASGLGKQVSFEHGHPTIVAKES